HAWLPRQDGTFARPADLDADELPQEFEPNEALASALGMPVSEEKVLAARLGLDLYDLELVRRYPHEFARFKLSLCEGGARGQQNDNHSRETAPGKERRPPTAGDTPYAHRLPQTPAVAIDEAYLTDRFPDAEIEYWEDANRTGSGSGTTTGGPRA